MITITDAQRNSLQITKKGIVLVRLFYGDETANTDYIAIASQALPSEWTDNEYRPLLISSPVVSSGVDIYTHKFKASELLLEISNGDYHPGVKFSDLITDSSLGAGNDWGFENRTCEIRLQTQGVTSWANCIQMFKGVTRDIRHNANIITFSIQDEREIIHREIGTLLLDSDAADTSEGLPPETVGKIRPVIYGTQTNNRRSASKATVSAINRAIAEMPYLGVDPSANHRWFVADHTIEQINNTDIWGFDTGRQAELKSAITIEQNTSSGTIISHASDAVFYDYYYGKGTITLSETGTHVTGFVNKSRVLNKGFAAASTGSLDGDAIDDVAEFVKLKIEFPSYDKSNVVDADIAEILPFWFGKMTYAGAVPVTDAEIDLNIIADGAPRAAVIIPSSGSYPDLRLPETDVGGSLLGVSVSLEFELIVQSGIGKFDADQSATLDIYEMYKRIEWTPPELLPLSFGGLGREYTFTRGGHDEASSGVLIENPAGGIEDLYLNELGLVTADIDTSNFDTSSNTLTGWKFAFFMTKPTASLSLIQGLALESRSFVWLKPDRTVTMKSITDTYTSSDRIIDFSLTISPKFTRTRPQNHYTAVNVEYGLDIGGKNTNATGISEDTTMQTKYNLTEAQSTLNFRTKYISDSTTATNLRSYLLAQWKQPHNLFEGSLPLDHIDLDIGDVIEFENMPFKVFGEDITGNVERTGQTIYKYWWIFDVKRSSTGVKIKAMQLHKLD